VIQKVAGSHAKIKENFANYFQIKGQGVATL